MFCPNCGNQSASQTGSQTGTKSSFCSSCGVGFAPSTRGARIVRPRHPRMIAGVCSGIAIHYGWDLTMLRTVLAVAACLTTGAVVLFYLAAWLLLPDAPYALPAGQRYAYSNTGQKP